MSAIRILGLSGSLRSGSHNTALLRAAALSLPSGVELEVYRRPPGPAPLRRRPRRRARRPKRSARLREAIADADGVLISTPEFNGSIPGALKNALDWASRPFPDNALRGKPVAVVGASTGLFGAVWAQAETKKVLGIIGADVLDGELPVGQASGAFGDDGHLVEPDLRTALEELLGVLAARVGARESQAV